MSYILKFLIALSLALLFLNSLPLISGAFLIVLIFSKVVNIDFRLFISKLNQLSFFCISIYLSYFIIGLYKKDINLILIYSADATIIIFKILDAVILNLLLDKIDIKKHFNSELTFLTETIKSIEENFFHILSKYPKNIDKLRNIDNILILLFVKSLKDARDSKDVV